MADPTPVRTFDRMSATRRQHVRRSCLRTLLVALVGTSAAGTTAGAALGAAPAVLPLTTGCGLLVTVPVGAVQAGLAVAALPGGQPLAVAFTGPLISAAGTTVALASADVGASGVRVTLTVDGVAQQPVTLVLPGCVAAAPGSATPTVDLSPPPPPPSPGTPAEGQSPVPAPSPADSSGRQVTGLAELTSPGPSDAVPSPSSTSQPLSDPLLSAQPLSAQPATDAPSAEPPFADVAGPAVPLLEPPSAGTTTAVSANHLVTQLSAAGPVVADAPLAKALLSASPSTAARFPASLSPASLSSAALAAGSSPVAGALPQVALPATAPPDSGDASTLTGSELPISAASRLLHLGGPAAGADLATTAVLLAGALAVVVGQAARRRRWAHVTHAVRIGAVTVSAAPGSAVPTRSSRLSAPGR